jgi:hypothetical protein
VELVGRVVYVRAGSCVGSERRSIVLRRGRDGG